ncbi:SCO3242 family prenyltransferase [Streptomyces sp. NPDC088178]|uniref:SCO3242 family prenyltransferase n=1 Tax=Streptomyces sp. NPDC088178 TaxID=3365836 RepID=UPI00381A00E0
MTVRAWAELLRVSALFTVPGDALAGAAATGLRPDRGTALAVGASLCLYEAGMALNDWADRDEDAVDRPHRPIPSGRISPGAALAAAGALTAAGLGLAARAGRPALAVATGLAATVWAYDLRLKHTPAGPAAMAAARGLDLLLGATATGAATTGTAGPGPDRGTRADSGRGRDSGRESLSDAGRVPPSGSLPVPVPVSRSGSGSCSGAAVTPASGSGPASAAGGAARGSVLGALPAAGLLGAHTYAVTAVSRHEAQGGSTITPLAALAATAALGAAALRERRGPRGSGAATRDSGCGGRERAYPSDPSPTPGIATAPRLLLTALTGAYLRTAAGPLLHAALNPSPPLTRRAVGSGIRAMIPLQAALAARAGAAGTGLAVMGLVPLARTLARKVSPT